MALSDVERTRGWRARKKGGKELYHALTNGRGRPRIYTPEEARERIKEYQQKYYLEVTKPKRKAAREDVR
jgi:hypothetical protein